MDVEKTINRAVVELLRKFPFYGHVISQFPKIYTERIPTLAVGKVDGEGLLINLYINPKYIEEIYSKFSREKAFNHFVEVVKHETLHTIFKHIFIQKTDASRFQIACELSVNSFVVKENFVQKGIYPSDYGFSERLSIEEYYNLLEGKKKEDKSEKQSENNSENFPGQMVDSHELWQTLKEDGRSEILLRDIVRKAKDVVTETNQWGNTPREIIEAINSILEIKEEKIAWQTVLKDFVASSSENVLNYTNKRISKRYGTRPGIRKEDTLKLAIGIDTSGSVRTETIEMFFSELYWISKANVDVIVFECDDEIQREYPFRLYDSSSVKGRGGTDLEPVFRESSERHFDALIYFTDGCAPEIGTDYNIPTLLVISGQTFHSSRETLPYPAQTVFRVFDDGSVEVW